MSTATFTPDSHRYEVDGVLVPSVSQVLELAGLDDVSMVPLHYLERARAIGTAVHEACQLLDEDDLDLDSLDKEIVGYVLAYQRFRQEHDCVWFQVEERGVAKAGDLKYGYCLDRRGRVHGSSALVDLKTASKKQTWWGIQTAAYVSAVDDVGGRERFAVQLAKDGSYKLLRHEDPRDFEVWLAALNVAHWKLAHGTKLR